MGNSILEITNDLNLLAQDFHHLVKLSGGDMIWHRPHKSLHWRSDEAGQPTPHPSKERELSVLDM